MSVDYGWAFKFEHQVKETLDKIMGKLKDMEIKMEDNKCCGGGCHTVGKLEQLTQYCNDRDLTEESLEGALNIISCSAAPVHETIALGWGIKDIDGVLSKEDMLAIEIEKGDFSNCIDECEGVELNSIAHTEIPDHISSLLEIGENYMMETAYYSLNTLSKAIFENNKSKGFWDDAIRINEHSGPCGVPVREEDFIPSNRNTGELIALMHSELSEALEAHRKDKMDDHLPQYKGLHVELADALIRILDFAGAHDIDIGRIVRSKIEYNKSRPHKHGKKF